MRLTPVVIILLLLTSTLLIFSPPPPDLNPPADVAPPHRAAPHLDLDFSQGTHFQTAESSGVLQLESSGPGTVHSNGYWISPPMDSGESVVFWDWVTANVDLVGQQENLIYNGDFEIPYGSGNRADGWIATRVELPARDSAEFTTGSHSMRLNPDNENQQYSVGYAANDGNHRMDVDPYRPAHVVFDMKYDTDEHPFRVQAGIHPTGGWPDLATYDFPVHDWEEQYYTVNFSQYEDPATVDNMSLRFLFDWHDDDHDVTAWIDNLRVFQDSPVAYSVRSSRDGVSWTEWNDPRFFVAARSMAGARPDRYIQFNVSLSTNDTAISPTIQDLEVQYTKGFQFDMPWDYQMSSVIDPFIEPAGVHGNLTRSSDGGNFEFEDGTPVRFWATQIGDSVPTYMTHGEKDLFCQRMAQLGFNLLKMSPRLEDDTDRMISACADAGVYIYLQLNGCGVSQRYLPNHWPTCKSWMESVMNRTNPYRAGVRFGDDPAIAIVQLLNEEMIHSMWRVNSSTIYTGQDGADFDSEFHTFLGTLYADTSALDAAWDDGTGIGLESGEDISNARRVYFNDWYTHSDTRFGDTDRYYAFLANRFYVEYMDYMRNDVGIAQLIIGNNQYYGLSELAARLPTDIMDHHSYFNHIENPSLSGEKVLQVPMSKAPHENIITYTALNDIEGYPLTVSESSYEMPNVYTSEWPLFSASYFSFQDWDMQLLFLYVLRDHWGSSWPDVPSAPREAIFNPVLMAQMPAASRIFQERMVTPGTQIVNLSYTDVTVNDYKYNRRAQNFLIPGFSNAHALETRIQRHDFNASSDSTPASLQAQYGITNPGTTLTTTTGELEVDSLFGSLVVDSPRTQGYSGFTPSTNVSMSHLELEIQPSANNFSTISLVPLDGMPVAESAHMLLTAAGRSENSNTAWNPERTGYDNPYQHNAAQHWGTEPVLVEGINANITLTNTNGTNLIVHELTNLGQQDQTLTTNGMTFEISETYETLWYEIILDQPPRNPPTTIPIPDIAIAENQPASFTIEASDPENDLLTITPTFPLPTGAIFTDHANGTASFSWTPDFNQSGFYPLDFTISDTFFDVSQLVNITVAETNRLPSLDPTNATYPVYHGRWLNLTFTASDPDTDPLNLTLYPMLPGASFENGNLSYLARVFDVGQHPTTLTASDLNNGTDSRPITFEVLNHAPSLDPSTAGNYTVDLNDTFYLQPAVEDLDLPFGDMLAFTTSILDPRFQIDPTNGSIIFSANTAGNATGTVSVSDLIGDYDSIEITFIVPEPDTPNPDPVPDPDPDPNLGNETTGADPATILTATNVVIAGAGVIALLLVILGLIVLSRRR